MQLPLAEWTADLATAKQRLDWTFIFFVRYLAEIEYVVVPMTPSIVEHGIFFSPNSHNRYAEHTRVVKSQIP